MIFSEDRCTLFRIMLQGVIERDPCANAFAFVERGGPD
jgi:hypothetical protein